MCGFVAVLRLDDRAPRDPILREMRDTMEHRGPDSEGAFVADRVGLAHRRLSILDLSTAGHQPMSNEDGTLWLVFNGEIYNYVELRRELRNRGHRFSSSTDSEVILHLYEEMGESCVDELTGMFSFAIWDTREGKLFGARDRLGIKPFHYYADDGMVIFASEIKAILEHPEVAARPDDRAIADFMYCGFPLEDRTVVSGIRRLRPGRCIAVDEGGVRTHEYWSVRYRYRDDRPYEDTVAEVRSLLDLVVLQHCRSDAPLGCHLSGGLDSSTVTGLASRHASPLPTFSIRFGEGDAFDETRWAREVAQHVGADYHEAVGRPGQFLEIFPVLVWHMEMPLPNYGGFSYYTVSRLARDHVKVALTGHGGDELFGGYSAQFEVAFGRRPAGHRPPVSQGMPLGRLRRLRRRVTSLGLAGLFDSLGARFTGGASKDPSPDDLWAALHCGMLPGQNPILGRSFRRGLDGYSPRSEYMASLDEVDGSARPFDRYLHHDLRSYLPGLLHMEDRVSMAVSIESRVPLLDHRLVELLATVPPQQKVRGLRPKQLLRDAARGVLPEPVRLREDKQPFPVPIARWLRSELADFAREVLTDDRTLDRGIFDPGVLRRGDLSGHESWQALNVELWSRIFIDGDPPGALS